MRKILDRDFALVQNLLAYLEDELRSQPGKKQLADLCRIAVDTLDSKDRDEQWTDQQDPGMLINVRFSVNGPARIVSCGCD